MANLQEPYATQIIDLTQENLITCNEEALRKIFLDPAIKNKQVCIVSITGTLRQGKSFFLNFLLRYLKLKYQVKQNLPQKWLEEEENIKCGFPWKAGSDRHTRGILVWPEVFVADLASGEEIAIVLLDTQGMLESKKTPEDPISVFAIATLLSSFQILNVNENLDNFDLAPFECFSGVAGDRFLQKLCILIRDWPFQLEFSYGMSGGKDLLEHLKHSKDVPKELQTLRESILQLFEEITCCILPSPGTNNNTNSKFMRYVEDFIPSFLAPENLTPKVINGKPIKVSDLYYLVQTFCQHFQKKKISLSTMHTAVDEALLKAALNDCEQKYAEAINIFIEGEESIESDLLEECHFEQKHKLLQMFDEEVVVTNTELKKVFKKQLKRKLGQKFLEYRRTNRTKQEKEQTLEKLHKQQLETELINYLNTIKKTQDNVERLLLDDRKKNDDDKFQLIIECLNQNRQHKEELKMVETELERTKQKMHEDKLAHLEKSCKMEIEKKVKILEDQIKKLEEENEKLRVANQSLEKVKDNLTKTIEEFNKINEKEEEQEEEEEEEDTEETEDKWLCIIQ